MSVKLFSVNDWENWIKSKLNVDEDERLVPNKNAVVCKGCAPPSKSDGNCFKEIKKDPYTGNCYKACPYICKEPVYNDTKSTEKNGCDYDNDCSGCGVRLFLWDCPKIFGPIISNKGIINYDEGTMNEVWGDDTIFKKKGYIEPSYIDEDIKDDVVKDEDKEVNETKGDEIDLITDYDLGYSEMSQNIKNMLDQIKELQEKEEELFIKLENETDTQEKELILEQINNISTQRVTILKFKIII